MLESEVAVRRLAHVARLVAANEIVDARTVALIVGLRQLNSVSTYKARYSDMRKPVANPAGGRIRLRIRPHAVRWVEKTGRKGRTRNPAQP